MKLKTPREKRILYIKTAVRWLLYILVIFFSFVTMTSGSWKKPVLLVPVALCIAINTDVMISAFTGAFCGFLIDIACGRLFGYNAVILTVFCIVSNLIFELYLRKKFFSYMAVSAAVSFLQCWLDYKFFYEIWDYPDVERIFHSVTLKVWIYTLISSVIVFLIFKLINHLLMPREHLTIEEAIRSNK